MSASGLIPASISPTIAPSIYATGIGSLAGLLGFYLGYKLTGKSSIPTYKMGIAIGIAAIAVVGTAVWVANQAQ